MIPREPMKNGRFNAALALLIDKFIFAIGGSVSKGKATDVVEAYDTTINAWYSMSSLKKARSCTSAITIANRYIYVFPGQQSGSWNTIEQLDLGLSIDPKEMKKLKWNMLTISNQDMQGTFAYGAVQVSSSEVLIFGGTKSNTFLF